MDAGFTPGLASVLTGADGRRIFLKAASKKAQRPFADAYREEIRKLRSLPSGLPVPRLLWSHEDDLWVVLALEYVDGHNPVRPWRRDELDACLDTLELVAQTLTPPADAAGARSPRSSPTSSTAGSTSGPRYPDWPHLDEAVALASRYATASVGNTLVHTDARDDNFLLTAGRAYLCDWNWPVLGRRLDRHRLPADVARYGDGLDADAVLAERRLTRTVRPRRHRQPARAVLRLLPGPPRRAGAALLALPAGAPGLVAPR